MAEWSGVRFEGASRAWGPTLHALRPGTATGALHAVDQMGVALCDPSVDVDEVLFGPGWGDPVWDRGGPPRAAGPLLAPADVAAPTLPPRCPACEATVRAGAGYARRLYTKNVAPTDPPTRA